MFPNPQSALPLPRHPNLERYRKLAKELVQACRSPDEKALGEWARRWISALLKTAASPIEIPASELEEFLRHKLAAGGPAGQRCMLADAQFAIARCHGFESWPKFARHLDALGQINSLTTGFEAAADAIVSGNLALLQRLLLDAPDLVRARSTREHAATLLHYVSANGVEGFRQRTPENIVEIAELLLNAGAAIDATAKVYGGACTTLELAATSSHPERAGVQEALLGTLLDHSAKLEPSIVNACLANNRPKAAEFLAMRGASLDLASAAGLGRVDLVEKFLHESGSVPTRATRRQLETGFLYACAYGQDRVVECLLEKGIDLRAHRGDGQTGLHWAVIGGHVGTVSLLLRHKAPLEARNAYGGTVFGQALWSAAHGGDPETYKAILDSLVTAGAIRS